MGLFDTVRCPYPLPHHQDAEFQTKAIEYLLEGGTGLAGTMSEYEITEAGALRVHMLEREWREGPDACLGGWEDIATSTATFGST